jgi:hypothetical protein
MRRNISLLFVIFSAACAALPKDPIEQPKVDVTAVAITEISEEGLIGAIDMNVLNPNMKAVPLTSVDWELQIGAYGEGTTILGHSDVRTTIPGLSSAPVVASLRLGAFEAVGIAPLIAQGQRDYRLRTTLHFASPLGDVPVTVEKDGTLR